jgi:hypothetical protein
MRFAMPLPTGSTTAFAAMLGLLAAPAAGAPTATPTAMPAFDAAGVIGDAARTLASERRGVVAMHRHVAAQQHAPGHDGSIDEQAGLLREGNHVVAVRVYSRQSGGAAGATLAKAQTDGDKNLPDDDYQLPLREEFLSDYTFETAGCDGCAAGTVAIHFKSLKRDQTHGDGVAVVDTASQHFVRLDFVPSVLPQHVDKASISIVFGRALPSLWDVLEMDQHYSGHMLFLSGGADITTTLDNYRSFKSRKDGLKALDSGV